MAPSDKESKPIETNLTISIQTISERFLKDDAHSRIIRFIEEHSRRFHVETIALERDNTNGSLIISVGKQRDTHDVVNEASYNVWPSGEVTVEGLVVKFEDDEWAALSAYNQSVMDWRHMLRALESENFSASREEFVMNLFLERFNRTETRLAGIGIEAVVSRPGDVNVIPLGHWQIFKLAEELERYKGFFNRQINERGLAPSEYARYTEMFDQLQAAHKTWKSFQKIAIDRARSHQVEAALRQVRHESPPAAAKDIEALATLLAICESTVYDSNQ